MLFKFGITAVNLSLDQTPAAGLVDHGSYPEHRFLQHFRSFVALCCAACRGFLSIVGVWLSLAQQVQFRHDELVYQVVEIELGIVLTFLSLVGRDFRVNVLGLTVSQIRGMMSGVQIFLGSAVPTAPILLSVKSETTTCLNMAYSGWLIDPPSPNAANFCARQIKTVLAL